MSKRRRIVGLIPFVEWTFLQCWLFHCMAMHYSQQAPVTRRDHWKVFVSWGGVQEVVSSRIRQTWVTELAEVDTQFWATVLSWGPIGSQLQANEAKQVNSAFLANSANLGYCQTERNNDWTRATFSITHSTPFSCLLFVFELHYVVSLGVPLSLLPSSSLLFFSLLMLTMGKSGVSRIKDVMKIRPILVE